MLAIGVVDPRSGYRKRNRAFAIIFSEVMAEKAAGMAWVLAPLKPEDPSQVAEPNEEGVWIQVENPTLRGNPNVSHIIWVINKDEVQSVLWTWEGESLFFG